jgi:hypothetical protein
VLLQAVPTDIALWSGSDELIIGHTIRPAPACRPLTGEPAPFVRPEEGWKHTLRLPAFSSA